MTAPTPDHPLSGFDAVAAPGAVEITPRPYAGVLLLRADREAARRPVSAAFDGLAPPAACGETAAVGAVMALWLGPDEWMLVTPPGDEVAAAAAITQAFGGAHHQVTDVSDNYALVSIDGAKAVALLSKLVAIDLHPRAFSPGRCASTLLAKANVHLWRAMADAGDAPDAARFRLIVRASHAEYVWRLLAEAAREWGVTPPPPAAALPMHGTGAVATGPR